MALLKHWVKKTVAQWMDPTKEDRIAYLVKIMQEGLRREKQAFSVTNEAVQGLQYGDKDVSIAAERLYRSILTRGWEDGRLTQQERETARWVAHSLGIPPARAFEITLEFAQEYFASALADAMEDGVLDEREETRLADIAASVGMSTGQFVNRFFLTKGESFLRGMFLAAVEDNHLSEDEWNRLITTAEKLGVSRQQLHAAISPQAQQFVERVLADAKSDGRLSRQEDETFTWLFSKLLLPPDYMRYVEGELELLRTLTTIGDGKLPHLECPNGVAIRAGEIVHLHEQAIWRHLRMLKSGPRQEDHRGVVTLTDTRLIFSAPTKSQSINYRKIVTYQGGLNWFEVQTEGKPVSTFIFQGRSPLYYRIFETAVGRANQTIVEKISGNPSRHIQRDIRQRVWQRYGGRCAECQATDYLEFDHIIPVAKGGSNSENNIQLLCRRCNSKKSDHI